MGIIIRLGDITKVEADAVVNAANSSLLGGGGVDGAIHRAAGPGLLAECRLLNGCLPGDAKLTAGYQLPAKYVIHTVGPIWKGGQNGEAEILRSCYEKSLSIAAECKLSSIAFPAISTGIYGYPIRKAAEIALHAMQEHLMTDSSVVRILAVCFGKSDYDIYQNVLHSLTGND